MDQDQMLNKILSDLISRGNKKYILKKIEQIENKIKKRCERFIMLNFFEEGNSFSNMVNISSLF